MLQQKGFLSIVNQLLIYFIAFGIIQGLIFLILIPRLSEGNQKANRILFWFILLVVLSLCGRMVLAQGAIKSYPHAYLIIDILFYFYGPLLYFYVINLLNAQPIFKQTWMHFIIAAAHILTMVPYAFMAPQDYLNHIYTIGIWIYPYDWILALIHIGFYVVMSLKTISKVIDESENELSYQIKIDFLKKVIYTMIFFVIGWFHSFLVEVLNFPYGIELYQSNLFWLSFPLFSIFIGYFAINQPDLLRSRKEKSKYRTSLLSDDEVGKIKSQLDHIMEKEKPYLNPQLTIDDLADLMSVHKKDLSRVINETTSYNFFEFINSYRIKEFKHFIEKGASEQFSLAAIASDSGFNSKTAFNTVFKRFMKQTPSEYIKSLN